MVEKNEHDALIAAGWSTEPSEAPVYRRGDAMLAYFPNTGWDAVHVGVNEGFARRCYMTPQAALDNLRTRIARGIEEKQQELDALAEHILVAQQALEEIA